MDYQSQNPTSSRTSHRTPTSLINHTHRSDEAPHDFAQSPLLNQLYQKIHHFSSSKLTAANQKNISSFSRGLSSNPMEVLKSNRTQKSPERSPHRSKAVVGADIVPTRTAIIHLPRLDKVEGGGGGGGGGGIDDKDGVTYSSGPRKQQGLLSYNTGTLMGDKYLQQEKDTRSKNFRMSVPSLGSDVKKKAALLATHTVTLELNPPGFNSLSRTNKSKKLITRSNQLPKSLNEDRSHSHPFSEDSLLDTSLTSQQAESIVSESSVLRKTDEAHPPVSASPDYMLRKTDEVQPPVSASPDYMLRKTDEAHPPVSASPDYMLLGAEFSQGHLILMDREGVVMQKFPESESEVDLGSHSVTQEGAQDKCGTDVECGPGDAYDTEFERQGDSESGTKAPPTTAVDEVRGCVNHRL